MPFDEILANIPTMTIVLTCGIGLISIIATVVIIFFVFRYVKKTVGTNQVVMQQGIDARAKIISAQQTGVMLNDQPQVLFQLEVNPPTGMPYQTSAKAVIPIFNIPQFQPGAEVAVKIHPADPNVVEIVGL